MTKQTTYKNPSTSTAVPGNRVISSSEEIRSLDEVQVSIKNSHGTRANRSHQPPLCAAIINRPHVGMGMPQDRLFQPMAPTLLPPPKECCASCSEACRSRCCDCCMRRPCIIATSVMSGFLIVTIIIISVVLTTLNGSRSSSSTSGSGSTGNSSGGGGSIAGVNLYAKNFSISTNLTENHAYSRYQGVGSNYYYDTIQVAPTINGTYTFMTASTIDTYGYMYENSFLPAFPNVNLLASDDSSAGNGQFALILLLQPTDSYYLVITTYLPNVTGSYTLLASGPQSFGIGFMN
ncbi:unnamed protein product [Rotaria socialis]|uniref:Uncharacterized protein n=1 Tax=Rotaria socialis TaxID=392032 RepID=A0A817T3N1_9BILA|nr:unnamed protein product [Rotaria socialis]CAF4368553.1 unnamed protein product [Rotaria socialis]